ncbi:MAG: two-component regulator propeller domain-containing protein [Bacteroidota bacterium]
MVKKYLSISLILLVAIFVTYAMTSLGQNATNSKVSPSADTELLGPLSDKNPPNDPSLEIRAWTNCIHEDNEGTMWFGTRDWGVIKYDGDTLVYLTVNDGLGGNIVRDMVETEDGTLWLATSNGVSSVREDSFETFYINDGLGSNDLYSLEISQDGSLWIGSEAGVSVLKNGDFTEFSLPAVKADSVNFVRSGTIVHDILEDSKGNMWFGTNGGAFKFDGSSLSHLNEESGLCGNAVKSILEDDQGNIWFSTHDGGACVWNCTEFSNVKTELDPHGSLATSGLFQDSQGNVWIPTDHVSMFRYENGRVHKMFQPQGCISHALRTTYEDSKGRLWFGGWLGVYRLDPI